MGHLLLTFKYTNIYTLAKRIIILKILQEKNKFFLVVALKYKYANKLGKLSNKTFFEYSEILSELNQIAERTF